MNRLFSGLEDCRECENCIEARIKSGAIWFCGKCSTDKMTDTKGKGQIPYVEIDRIEDKSRIESFVVNVPDWCQMLITTYGKVYNSILQDQVYCDGIEKIASKKPSSNKGHDYEHVRRVIGYGEKFIRQYNEAFPDLAANMKDLWLFRIAALLHDFGRAEGEKNHSKRSADFAQQYLEENTVINGVELDRIVNAIAHHSDGKAMDDIIAVALYLGDKLDMTKERIVADAGDKLSSTVEEMKKIEKIEYIILKDEDNEPIGAELYYMVGDGFDLDRFNDYEKWINVPLRVTTEYLGLDQFELFVNDTPISYRAFLNSLAVKDDHPIVV